MLKIKELKEKLNKYDDDTLVAFEMCIGENYEDTQRLNLITISFVDYLGEFDEELIFNLENNDGLVEKVED